MKISIFNSACYTIFITAIINPILAGFFTEGLGLVYKMYTLLLFVAAFLVITRYQGSQSSKFIMNPATCFIYYLILQSCIVTLTAGSKLHNVVYELSAYLLPCLSILLITTFVSKHNDGNAYWIINLVIYAAIVSIILDALGCMTFFAGRYKELLDVRYGVRQLHGFMPWPNGMATVIVVFGILQQILKPNSAAYKMGYVATFGTITRAYILSAVFLLIISLKSRKNKILAFVFLVVFAYFSSSTVKESTYEIVNPDTVYRLQYVWASSKVLADNPIFGIGLGRLSDSVLWKYDNFSLHNQYQIPSEFYSSEKGSWEMASSDTSLTLFAEIGCIGSLLFVLQLAWFIRIAIKANSRRFLIILVPMFLPFYSTPNIFFSFTIGIFYWFLYGILISKYYKDGTAKTNTVHTDGLSLVPIRGFDE
jgi:hypothetical protein